MDNIYPILAKICSFFRSDGIIFMPKFRNGKHLAVPTFGKYALMVDDEVNFEYSYFSIDISKIDSLLIENFPRFYKKSAFLSSNAGWLGNDTQLLNSTYSSIENTLNNKNVKIFTRDMTSTTYIDVEIWKEVSSIDELIVKIDLGLKFKRS